MKNRRLPTYISPEAQAYYAEALPVSHNVDVTDPKAVGIRLTAARSDREATREKAAPQYGTD
ncbi:MAG: hypothetical protein L7T24_02295 [Luminiphilus sp.]|nr:hypothetical protein [Luminiphilus sp.]